MTRFTWGMAETPEGPKSPLNCCLKHYWLLPSLTINDFQGQHCHCQARSVDMNSFLAHIIAIAFPTSFTAHPHKFILGQGIQQCTVLATLIYTLYVLHFHAISCTFKKKHRKWIVVQVVLEAGCPIFHLIFSFVTASKLCTAAPAAHLDASMIQPSWLHWY